MVNETSTPKRVSFYDAKFNKNGSTPLRRKSIIASAIQKVPDVEIPHFDDDEDRIRRRSLAQAHRRSNSLTPNLNISDRSVPSPAQNQSVSAIESHFKKCMTLFATNKINAENAWHLVGYMDYIKLQLRQHTDSNVLLQTASSAVEVGAKILSVQIDDVHSKTWKLANQLSKVKLAGETDEDRTNSKIEEMETEEPENEKNRKEKKKRTKRQTKRMIVDDDDSLNAPVEPHRLLLTINENEYSNKMLCSKPIKNFQLLSVVQSKQVLWSDITFDKINETVVDSSLQTQLQQIASKLSTFKICPSLKDFAVDTYDINKDETLLDNSMDLDQMDCNDGGNPWHIEPHPQEMNESVMEDLDIQGEYDAAEPVFLTDMRPTLADITSNQRLSMFIHRNLPTIHDRVWAGPAHWKLKILRKNKENTNPNGKPNEMQKAKKPPKVTNPFNVKKLVTYDLFKADDKMYKNSVKTTRKTLKLNTNLPENMKMSHNFLLNLTGVEIMRVKHHGQKGIEHQENLNKSYVYDNQNDADYCNLTSCEPGENADIHDDNHDHEGDHDNSFDDYNAIMDEKMGKDSVPFALKAKRMDMKKLKGYIWEDLSKDIENNTNHVVIKPKRMSEVYTKLPQKMSHSMMENLSCPLAFVALLHLANEQNLFLEPTEDRADIIISKN